MIYIHICLNLKLTYTRRDMYVHICICIHISLYYTIMIFSTKFKVIYICGNHESVIEPSIML